MSRGSQPVLVVPPHDASTKRWRWETPRGHRMVLVGLSPTAAVVVVVVAAVAAAVVAAAAAAVLLYKRSVVLRSPVSSSDSKDC